MPYVSLFWDSEIKINISKVLYPLESTFTCNIFIDSQNNQYEIANDHYPILQIRRQAVRVSGF